MYAKREKGRSRWAFRPLVDLRLETRQLQSVAGSIFVATATGGQPQGSSFATSTDVYIGVGSGPKSQLAPGNYYFQVTDPSGKTLLSTDSISSRSFFVGSNGQVLFTSGHATSPTTGGPVVQAWPYNPQTQGGGPYKVWVTPIDAYNPQDSQSVFGFSRQDSLTDSFKVQSPTTPTEPPPDGGGLPAVAQGGSFFFFTPGQTE